MYCYENRKMARILKQIKNKFRIILLTILVLLFISYLLKKRYDVVTVYNERSTQKDSNHQWIFSVFKSGDTSSRKDLSLLEIEFYILLFDAVSEDVSNLLLVIRNKFSDLKSLIYQMIQNLFITVISVCIIIISVYYLLIKTSDKKLKQQNESRLSERSETKDSSSSVLNSSMTESVVHIYRVNRMYARYLIHLVFLAFLLTIPWEFVRQYQSVVAEKVTHTAGGIPADCVPEQMSLVQSVKSWFRWQFSWNADPCLLYHKALLVDPIWQVSPLQVLSSALLHCIVYPVEILLGGLGRACRAFFAEIPIQWQPLMLVIIVVFLLLSLIMLFGYRIHLPFILKFEPRTPVSLRDVPRKSVRISRDRCQKSTELTSKTDLEKKT